MAYSGDPQGLLDRLERYILHWSAMAPITEPVIPLLRECRDALAGLPVPQSQGWRCFHCDEVFTDKADAREHFGELLDDAPLCQVRAEEGGLAARIRELELELADALNQRNEYENDARLWHESEADRIRRIGHVQWWQEMDSREGEKLVLQERVKELKAALAAGLPVPAEPPKNDLQTRLRRFNSETGSLTGGNTHPDRCVCQEKETGQYADTPHKHYEDAAPFSCARCRCLAYKPIQPLAAAVALPPQEQRMSDDDLSDEIATVLNRHAEHFSSRMMLDEIHGRLFQALRGKSAVAPLQPHTDLQAKLDNALETYRTVAHALQADVIRLNDLRKAAGGCLHPEPHQEKQLHDLAKVIATRLFTSGNGEGAMRLELKDPWENGLGGWAFDPAVREIERALRAAGEIAPPDDRDRQLKNIVRQFGEIQEALQAAQQEMARLKSGEIAPPAPPWQPIETALQAGLVGQWRNEAVLVLNHSEIHEREGAAALRRCADELERAIQALRPPGEIATPAPPSWQPSELALIASVFADAAHEAGESDEEDVRLEAPMLSALSRKAALAVPRDYNPLPPAPPQAPEPEP